MISCAPGSQRRLLHNELLASPFEPKINRAIGACQPLLDSLDDERRRRWRRQMRRLLDKARFT
jgi:hypothetical protein